MPMLDCDVIDFPNINSSLPMTPDEPHIAVDIDDTLYSFRDAAMQVLSQWAEADENVTKALYTPWVQWRTPHDMLGDVWLDTINAVHDNDMILAQEPYQHVVPVMRALSESGNKFVYISNRATETKGATYEWLVKSGFPIDGHELVCTQENKMDHVRHCQYIIDDRTKTIVQFVTDVGWQAFESQDKPRIAFGLMKDYNQNLTDLPNIYLAPTWIGLAFYLRKKGLLTVEVDE